MLIPPWLHRGLTGLFSLSAIALTPLPGLAAETVSFDFRLLGRSVPTASLAHFAETGEADAALAPYLRRLTPDQKDGLRKALTASRPVNLQHLSQWFLYDNTSHTAGLTRLVDSVFHINRDFEQGVEEALALNRNTSKALAIAVAQVYLKGDLSYEPFLRSAYVETVSEAPLRQHLIRELPDVWLPSAP